MRQNHKWVFYVASRFGTVDYRGRSAMTSLFSILGIAFGVMTLIVILAVMNGFQMGYIDSIMEVSSAHVQIEGDESILTSLIDFSGVSSLHLFTETQALIQGKYRRQSGVLLRGIPEDLDRTDKGFSQAMMMQSGSFDIHENNSIILGYELARMLSIRTGDMVSLVAVAGGADTDLFPEHAEFQVSGLFKTGYYEIDSTFAFVNLNAGRMLCGESTGGRAAIKLESADRDRQFIRLVTSRYPEVTVQSWRDYNRAFFGALRIEKNMLFLLVVLIFVVVTVNIYNGMRRAVYERREEISVLSALGGHPRIVQLIFVANGLGIGLSGGVAGLLAGLLLSVRINDVFGFAEILVNWFQSLVSAIFLSSPGDIFALFSPEYFYIDLIPVRILLPEVIFVFLFGVFSASCAAWFASRAITRLKPAEVLRDE